VLGALIGLLRARWPRPMPRWIDVTLIGAAATLSVVAFALVHSFHGAR
jgi:hypothetical protein